MTPIPLVRTSEPPCGGKTAAIALVVAEERPAPPGFALVRHAGAAAAAQAGGCTCCRVPSGLATVLRQLFLDRVRGAAAFESVVVVADDAAIAEALSDPLVAARYAYGGDPSTVSGPAPAV